TFTCYGSHLPGDCRGSFDHVRRGNRRFLPPNAALEDYHRDHLRQAPYCLSTASIREIVRDAIVEVCRYRSWFLYALHVRTTHVHAIADADCAPSRIFNAWKAYATRRLRASGEEPPDRIYWAWWKRKKNSDVREPHQSYGLSIARSGSGAGSVLGSAGERPGLTPGAEVRIE